MGRADIAYAIEYHPGALIDLDIMHGFIAARSESLRPADRFVAAVRAEVERLDRLPDGYPIASEPPPRHAFWIPFKRKYLIFFEVFEVERVCRVLYLWHAARSDRPDFARQDDQLP
ncbi:MAG: type II toxin-antitoxin system RelE/ParE family toxin [Planctomycetota bacterium]